MPVTAEGAPLEDSVTSDGRGGRSRPSDQPQDQNNGQGNGQGGGQDRQDDGADDPGLTDTELLQLARDSDRQATTFAQQNWTAAWDRNYKAFRSEHFVGSKYNSDEYRNRSRLFRPKTRSAVTKDLAATANSLFATIDAVTASAGDETDPMQAANAAVIQELVNYRLDRTSGYKNAIPWFLTSMGARQDADITGICCSKQYWEYREKTTTQHIVETDDDGNETTRPVTKSRVVRDKPCIDLIPPENVGLCPFAHWMDPVNDGAYFNVWYPMNMGEIRSMMTDKRFPWREVSDATILKARVQQFESGQVRRAREGGKDRMNDQRSTRNEFDVVWVCERFVRIDDEDICFWTLSDQTILSDPTSTEEVYPAFDGERPYKLGFGQLEAHRVVPQSMVEVGQQMQQEINDLVNLRLDNVKEALKPLTLVKRGKKVDIDRLKRRGHNTTILVDDPAKDIVFDRPTDVSSSAYGEMERLNVDFDDLAGVFNSGSVQSNRSLNETVGGMKLLSGAANAVTEFNVRTWVETWVEPVLAQLAKLEAYYESDETVLGLAKKRAKMFQRFGMDEVTDEMLEHEVYVRVSAGIGSADPMQQLQKMEAALKAFAPIAQSSPDMRDGMIKPNIEEFANEIFGKAGIRDAFERLFIVGQPAQQHPGGGNKISQSINFKDLPPEGQQQLAAHAGIQLQAQTGPDQQAAQHTAALDSKMKIAKLNAQTKIASQLIGHRHDDRLHQRDHRHKGRHKFIDVLSEVMNQHGQQQDRAQQARERMAGMGRPGAGGAPGQPGQSAAAPMSRPATTTPAPAAMRP